MKTRTMTHAFDKFDAEAYVASEIVYNRVLGNKVEGISLVFCNFRFFLLAVGRGETSKKRRPLVYAITQVH